MTNLDPTPPLPLTELAQKWEVQERPFAAQTPIIGPLIAAFRSAWNKISTKWYVLPMVQQQNEFNERTLHHLQQQWQMMENQHAWLINQSREQGELVHDLGEISVQLRLLQQQLEQINHRLDALEKR